MFESPSWLLSCQGSVGIIPTLYLRSSLNISIHFDQRITAVPFRAGLVKLIAMLECQDSRKNPVGGFENRAM